MQQNQEQRQSNIESSAMPSCIKLVWMVWVVWMVCMCVVTRCMRLT